MAEELSVEIENGIKHAKAEFSVFKTLKELKDAEAAEAEKENWLNKKLGEPAPAGEMLLSESARQSYGERFGTAEVQVPKGAEYKSAEPGGHKLDEGKTEYSLIPWDALDEIVRALQYGAYHKPRPGGLFGYGPNNWELVDDAKNRYANAAIRHIKAACFKGVSIDPDTKEHKLRHLAEAGCCVLFLLALDLRGKLDKDGPAR